MEGLGQPLAPAPLAGRLDIRRHPVDRRGAPEGGIGGGGPFLTSNPPAFIWAGLGYISSFHGPNMPSWAGKKIPGPDKMYWGCIF